MRGLYRRRWLWALTLAAVCAVLAGCGARHSAGARVLLNGREWDGAPIPSQEGERLRVYLTLDGEALIDLPFGAACRVEVLQSDGAQNVVLLTGDSVRMERANCEGQDCVDMGEVTRENLEDRVMGGFIICLPHRLSVEVRGG